MKKIVEAEEARRYVVPSAPGRRFPGDDKVTDLLYSCYDAVRSGEDIDPVFDRITERYTAIIDGLGIDLDLSSEFDQIRNSITHHAGRDYAASRGEYLNGIILAKLLGYDFIDAAYVIYFRENGSFDDEGTNEVLKELLKKHTHAVIPGFYGSMPNGTVKTFSRGGSDITGSVVARAAGADLYENFTDVSGFFMTDPAHRGKSAPHRCHHLCRAARAFIHGRNGIPRGRDLPRTARRDPSKTSETPTSRPIPER